MREVRFPTVLFEMSKNARLVYPALFAHTDNRGIVNASRDLLSRVAGLSKPTFDKAIKELEEADLIMVEHRRRKGNVYQIKSFRRIPERVVVRGRKAPAKAPAKRPAKAPKEAKELVSTAPVKTNSVNFVEVRSTSPTEEVMLRMRNLASLGSSLRRPRAAENPPEETMPFDMFESTPDEGSVLRSEMARRTRAKVREAKRQRVVQSRMAKPRDQWTAMEVAREFRDRTLVKSPWADTGDVATIASIIAKVRLDKGTSSTTELEVLERFLATRVLAPNTPVWRVFVGMILKDQRPPGGSGSSLDDIPTDFVWD